MPDWKRVIVGDAFQLSSRDFNYYRDLFLVWPFLIFTIAGLVDIFSLGQDHRIGYKCLGLSLISLLLARELLILIAGSLVCCAVQSGISFALKHCWIALAVSLSTAALFVLLIRSLKDYKPSYIRPRGIHIVNLLISLTSLGFTIAVFHWILR